MTAFAILILVAVATLIAHLWRKQDDQPGGISVPPNVEPPVRPVWMPIRPTWSNDKTSARYLDDDD